MANTCCVTIDLQFGNSQDADLCYGWLKKCVADAESGMFPDFGGSKFYMAMDCIDKICDSEIQVEGWVKWNIDEPSFTEFIRLIVSHYDLQFMRADWSEPGCDTQGRWEYSGETRVLDEQEYQPTSIYSVVL